MATYKVIQDIEADDTLLGPLTPRQVIYAAIVVISGFIVFKIAMTPAGWISIFFLPHMILFGTLAAPFGHDQSSEVWLLAKVRFMVKPRKRIWDQSGIKQLVAVTAPRQIKRPLTKNFSPVEVRSRLDALAATIDSRGWAVKNVNAAMLANPTYGYTQPTSDRLIDLSNIPQEVPTYNTQSVPDMMDVTTNPMAQNLTTMINASAQAHRQQAIATMNQGGQPVAPANPLFLSGAAGGQPPAPLTAQNIPAYGSNPVTSPGVQQLMASAVPNPSQDAQAQLLDKIRKDKEQDKRSGPTGRMKVIAPPGQATVAGPAPAVEPVAETTPVVDVDIQNEPQDNTVTPATDPAILMLASNDDLNVETIARQAKKSTDSRLGDDEVVISLH